MIEKPKLSLFKATRRSLGGNLRIYLQILFLLLIICSFNLLFCDLSMAVTQTDKNYLTLEILQEKLNNTVRQEGIDTIELNNYIIDLSQQDNEFIDSFYQQINYKINRTKNSIKLDFSDSIIQGNFELNRLGIATPMVEGALSSLLTPQEREQIKSYHRSIDKSQELNPTINVFRDILNLDRTVFTATADFSNILFLQKFEAIETNFQQQANFTNSIFAEQVDFGGAVFDGVIQSDRTHFYDKANFNNILFSGITNFSNSYFEGEIDFNNAAFFGLANFTRSIFYKSADFSKTIWRDRVLFSKGKFLDCLTLTDATFERNLAFRDVYVGSNINLQDVSLLDRVDFSNAFFATTSKINMTGLAFDAEEAKIIGESGTIGNVITLDLYKGNETVFRNLIRNFRNLEQINDANQIEYQREQLKLQFLGDGLIKTPWQKIFRLSWISTLLQWMGLSLLLLLGDYGTNFNLIFSVGILTIAFFSVLFWLIDRYRPQIFPPIVPTGYETFWMISSYLALTIFGTANVFISTDKPWLTLACVAIVLLPVPLAFSIRFFWQNKTEKLFDVTYFVENGEMRQFRLMLGRLPVMPRFYFFRDRFMPILWDKRWNWLNYYNLSLNNVFKLGFNDIRVRDEHLPGTIAILVWYQWCLGGLYTVILLWTLSRTIPGLNLLLYF
ncbi:pentapeptide repeat-containing protein [Myxosarcina sp. GI1]|uniref:pentapeptide repeat-containing protein n=1 Tax=Myxosarcina sp. GI1 TaxID=1541065 RepID=UPI00068C6F08|nr:pentapeptide repeat-containing protein [Myxosarcina sp. GI1]